MAMKTKVMFITLAIAFTLTGLSAQPANIWRIEPSGWWIGMKNQTLMVLAYGDNLSQYDVKINIPGVSVASIKKTENKNYLFIFLNIGTNAKAGPYNIEFRKAGNTSLLAPFQLWDRVFGSANRKSFNASDVIYLIMPDRFANGDTANDNMPGMKEKAAWKNPASRHGGDIKGISDHLSYISGLGATAIWNTPLLENNQPGYSYHGYAITDFYKIDPRFGSNDDYRKLAQQCHSAGLKLIMDVVLNHCGLGHWWMSDLPASDWVHTFPVFTRSNYRLTTVADMHASQFDRNLEVNAWFDNSMPDLNYNNNLLLTYMIQNSIWWIEYAGLDGFRVDTYPFVEKDKSAEWIQAIMAEYPNFNVVGEVWEGSASKICYWQKDFPSQEGYNSHLPALMDFPLAYAIQGAFNEKDGWNEGLSRLYSVLADDYLYPNPNNLVVFAENHDMARIYDYLGQDIRKFKMAMTFLATIRGIPQILYGSEILMEAKGSHDHPLIRKDFPGGWPGDSVNSFTRAGRSSLQNEAFDYMSKLLLYRKTHPVLQDGTLTQFIPADGIYTYFRELNNQAVMVLFNNNESEQKTVETARFTEILSKYKNGKDIMAGADISDLSKIILPAKSAMVIELSKD
jgi:neopullulanase